MIVEVVAAIIWDSDRFLVCQRPCTKPRPLLWEFPGGKVETGESLEDALIRECREELGITLSVGSIFGNAAHTYNDITIHLTILNATILEGTPQPLEHYDLHWITFEQITRYRFCPADKKVLDMLL